MSEYINNREYRQKMLKELIRELHDGKSVDEVKSRFEKLIKGVSTREITEMETALVAEGMPVEEIQRLCDVHAEVFKGSIEDIHKPISTAKMKGHPIDVFKRENRALEKVINQGIRPNLEKYKSNPDAESLSALMQDFSKLKEVEKHYQRKENIIFPFLEKYGITAPPKVMWGVDDEVRDNINLAIGLMNRNGSSEEIIKKVELSITGIQDMIFKEENILFPMCLDTLTEDEWVKVANDSDEIGYCLIDVKDEYQPVNVDVEQKVRSEGDHPADDGYIKFETGLMSQKEISAVFNTLPLDITFVDRDGVVKYFSQGKERIFPRTKSVIGRKVQNCHPPASVHVVEKIVEDLMSGKKDHEDFWIKKGDLYVFIRYFAVRDENGEFLGTLEVSQDIAPIQKLTGEKRLLEDE